MVELLLGFRPEHSSPASRPSGIGSSQDLLTQFLSSPESQGFSPSERRELSSLARERDAELFHSGLLHLAGRIENRDHLDLAARLYSLVQSQSEDPTLRSQAQRRLAVFAGGGSFGDRAEFLARRFVGQATEPGALIAMGIGGAAFRVARLGILGRLAASPAATWITRGFGARALAGTGAFLAESTAFTLTGHGLQALSGRSLDWNPGSLGREWASSALTLASLRGFGALGGGLYRRIHPAGAAWQGLYAQSAMFGGILFAHEAEARLGLREPSPGSNPFLEGLVTLLQFNVAGRLSREAFGSRWQAWERGLDLRTERLGRNIPPRPSGILSWSPLGTRPAVAGNAGLLGEARPLMMAGQPNGEANGSNGAAESPSVGPPPSESNVVPGANDTERPPSWWPTDQISLGKLRGFIDALPDTTVIFEFAPGEQNEGLVGRLLMVNQRVQDKFGYSPEEAIGMSLSRFTHPDDATVMARMQQAILQRERIKFREVRFVRKDGSELWCDVSGNLQHAGERIIGFAILQDVSARRKAQAQIQAERVRYQALLKGIPDVMFRISRDGVFLDAHAEHPENFVIPPSAAIGTSVYDLPLPSDLLDLARRTIRASLETGETQFVPYALPMPDGTQHFQEVRMTRSGSDEVVATIRDVTVAKEAENNRIAAARAEGFKLLGRGLGHDINGALTPLLVYVQNSKRILETAARDGRSLSPEELRPLAEDLGSAHEAAEQIREMVADFRELSYDPEIGPPFDLHALLKLSDLQATVGPEITVQVRLAAEPWMVPGPRKNLHRVIQNLVRNARDAMQGRFGLLRVETDRVVLSAGDLGHMGAPDTLSRAARNFMRVRIQDNGAGIQPENLRRIFEPYFTTKSKNDGAGHGGMGLSLTQKLVQDVGGFIRVESTPNIGTIFDVYLPQSDAAQSLEGMRNLRAVRAKPLLIVSQDQPFRDSVQAGLQDRGFSTVLLAHSFEQAQEIASQHPELGAVVTDYRLPGNQYGIKLLQSLRESRPNLPAILWSEHDPSFYSNILGTYGTAMDRSTSPSALGVALEDLISRRLRPPEPEDPNSQPADTSGPRNP